MKRNKVVVKSIVTAELANEPETRNLKAGETIEKSFEIETDDAEQIDHVVTAEDLEANKELAENGIKEGDTISITEVTENAQEQTHDDAFEKKMDRYKKRYPDNKVFYVSSDNQVFLESNKQDAIFHQKSIDQDKQIEVVEND